MKLVRSPIISLCTITWVSFSFTSYPAISRAQFYRPGNNFLMQRSQQAKQKSPDFSKLGRPGRRIGGGSRNPCPLTNPPLTALIPISNWGETVAERPTLWFYVPYSPQQVSSGKFVLQEVQGDKQEDYVYRDLYEIPFALPRTPGLVSFNIPATKAPLEIGKKYFWSFKLYCQPPEASTSDASSNPSISVEGWMDRVQPTPKLEEQLKAATEPEYAIYTNHLIWYDALDSLAKLRIAQPTNTKLVDEWTNLLRLKGIKSDDLDPEKLKQPIVGSVVVQSSQ